MSEFVIRGAHTTYMKDGMFYAPDQSHCPRISMLRSLGWNQPINETSRFTFALGLASETLFEQEFPTALRDVAVEFPLSERAVFQGHADGQLGNVVYELKSISSTRTAEKILVDKTYKEGHLLQLLGYMIALEKTKGVLRYCNFVYHTMTRKKEKVKMAPCNVDIPVSITDDGSIDVEGVLLEYNIRDVLAGLQGVAKHLESNTLPMIPAGGEVPFEGCCAFCPLSTACQMIGSVEGLEAAAKECGFVNLTKTKVPDTKEEFQLAVTLGGFYDNDSI